MPKNICTVDGCGNTHLAKGYCSAHWQRWHKTGDPGPAEIRRHDTRCSVEGCDREHYGHGYCNAHLRRFLRSGDPGSAQIKTKRAGCSVPDCLDPHSARGYCASHYRRWRREGDAGAAFTVRRRNPTYRNADGLKQCRVCDLWFPESSFNAQSSHPDGLSTRCRACHYAAAVARRYGVDPVWYAETLKRQGGGCAICGCVPGSRRLHVDHDHSHCSANKGCQDCVRGLLCSPCNTGIGMLGESIERLESVIAYLKSR